MGKKEKLKNQRKIEQQAAEVKREETSKKGKVFALLLLLACLAAYEIHVALSKDKATPAKEQTPATAPAPASANSEQPDAVTKTVSMETEEGTIKLELYASSAPKTVDNFLKLAGQGFYDGIRFHRIEPGFVIQAGDPATRGEDGKDFVYAGEANPQNLPVAGTGGPGYQFADEINSHKNVVGALAMANAGANTNGSQFYIITQQDQPSLDGHYTVFGRVLEGMDVVLKMKQGDRILKITELPATAQ